MLEKSLKEALQMGLDEWSDGKYVLDIEIRQKEVLHSRSNSSEVIEVYPVLVYLVSCAGMTYELMMGLPELSSDGSGTVSSGQYNNGACWRMEFPSARYLHDEATKYFKEELFKKLLDK